MIEVDKNELYDLYINQKLPMKKVAEQMGIISTVKKMIIKNVI